MEKAGDLLRQQEEEGFQSAYPFFKLLTKLLPPAAESAFIGGRRGLGDFTPGRDMTQDCLDLRSCIVLKRQYKRG